jgi:hypothetical protein
VVEGSYYILDGETRLHVGWIPQFTPARLAPPGKRFSLVPPDFPIPIDDRDVPAHTLGDSEGFVRVETQLGDVDMSVVALTQYDPYPTLLSVPIGTPPFVRLVPIFERRYMLGMDVETVVLDDWVAHAEMAQFFTEGDRSDDWLAYVVGVRRSFYPLDRELVLTVEYAGEWQNRDAQTAAVTTSDLQRIFTNALLCRLTLNAVDRLDVVVTGAVLFDGPESFYVQPEARYEIGDHTRITLGLDLFGGSRQTFFGGLKDDDRFYMSLKLAF